jgi:hypothetical protein
MSEYYRISKKHLQRLFDQNQDIIDQAQNTLDDALDLREQLKIINQSRSDDG